MAKETPHPSTLKASQNGTKIEDYAARVFKAQSEDMPRTFILSRVEDALIKQEYPTEEIMRIITQLRNEVFA